MGKSRFWSGLVLTVLVLFIAYQLYAVFYNPVSTEVVNKATTVNGLEISAIIIREEQLVKTNTENSLHFEVEDSERVSKDGVIANIYASSEQSLAASELVEVQKEIDDIEEIQKYNDLKAVDMSLLNKKIYDSLNAISFSADTGKFYGIDDYENELLTLLNRKQLATGKTVDFSAKLSSLKDSLEGLKAKVGKPISSVRAERSGYFVSTTDGYEGVLTPAMIGDLTPEALDNLKPEANNDKSVVGKLVSNYTWYIAASVSINDSLQFKVGDSYEIKTSLKSNPTLKTVVEKINMSAADDRAVLVFSCQEMSGELSSIRSGAFTVVKDTYTGIRVNSKALRIVNQTVTDDNGNTTEKAVTGVYVLNGMTANFVPVDIIYSAQSYALCRISEESGSLRIYDEIIVKGKNMYDGKIID